MRITMSQLLRELGWTTRPGGNAAPADGPDDRSERKTPALGDEEDDCAIAITSLHVTGMMDDYLRGTGVSPSRRDQAEVMLAADVLAGCAAGWVRDSEACPSAEIDVSQPSAEAANQVDSLHAAGRLLTTPKLPRLSRHRCIWRQQGEMNESGTPLRGRHRKPARGS